MELSFSSVGAGAGAAARGAGEETFGKEPAMDKFATEEFPKISISTVSLGVGSCAFKTRIPAIKATCKTLETKTKPTVLTSAWA
jgi:hypothetical protein